MPKEITLFEIKRDYNSYMFREHKNIVYLIKKIYYIIKIRIGET